MRFNPHITATAVVLALGGAAAPALASPQNLCGDACDGYGTAAHTASPQPAGSPVQPNPDEQVVISRANSTEPSAAATAAVQPNADERAPATSVRPALVRVNTPNGGFDWGDAGIGAAGALGLSLLGIGGALAVSQRRAHSQRRSPATTS